MANYRHTADPNAQGAEFDVIPANWYDAEIVASDIRDNNKGWAGIAYQWRITGPTHANRRIFDQITIHHVNSEQAVTIGKEQHSVLCNAVGLGGFNDTQELHGRPHQIRVGIKPASGQYEAKNCVKAFRPSQGAGQQGQGGGFPTGGGQAPQGGGAPGGWQQGQSQGQQAPPAQQPQGGGYGGGGGYSQQGAPAGPPQGGGGGGYGGQAGQLSGPPAATTAQGDPGYFDDDDIPF